MASLLLFLDVWLSSFQTFWAADALILMLALFPFYQSWQTIRWCWEEGRCAARPPQEPGRSLCSRWAPAFCSNLLFKQLSVLCSHFLLLSAKPWRPPAVLTWNCLSGGAVVLTSASSVKHLAAAAVSLLWCECSRCRVEEVVYLCTFMHVHVFLFFFLVGSSFFWTWVCGSTNQLLLQVLI